jgi:hypothetical protein
MMPTPAPESPPTAEGQELTGSVPIVDKDGYTYSIGFTINVGAFVSDVTNAKPGFVDASAPINGDAVAVTNTTPGREAPSPGDLGRIVALYSPNSIVCTSKAFSTSGFAEGKWAFTPTGAKYCLVNLTPARLLVPGTTIGVDSQTLMDWVNPGESFSYTSVSVKEIPEASSAKMIKSLNNPAAVLLDTGANISKPHGCVLKGRSFNVLEGIFTDHWRVSDLTPGFRICG